MRVALLKASEYLINISNKMSEESTSDTEEQSWGKRLINSIMGVGFGFVIIALASGFLFDNEGSYINQKMGLEEAQGITVAINDVEVVRPELDGKLLHATAEASTRDVLSDALFCISYQGMQLERKLEFYQWEEDDDTRKNNNGRARTTYNYRRVWVDSPINSGRFHERKGHENTVLISGMDPMTEYARKVRFGGYSLSSSQVRMMGNERSYSLSGYKPPVLQQPSRVEGDYLMISKQTTTSPQIGDMRVSWNVIEPKQIVSVVAQQRGASFSPYVSKSGAKVSLLEMGRLSAEEMYAAAHSSNVFYTWVIRIIGTFALMIAFCLILSPLSYFASFVPFLGQIVGFVTFVLGCLLGFTLSVLIIAVSWFFFRPMVAIAMILGIGCIIYGVIKLRRKKRLLASDSVEQG